MKTADIGKLFLVMPVMLLCACSEDADSNYEVLSKQNLTCPDGAQVEYAPWGGKPTGMIARCKLNHGPYLVAVDGRLRLRGESIMGKDHGEVEILDDSPREPIKGGGVEPP